MKLETFEERLSQNSLQPLFLVAHEKIKELYADKPFEFYVKNLLNKNETELFYFFKEEIVQVKFTMDKVYYVYPFNITQYTNKVKRKSITLHRSTYEPVELRIDLENGDSLNFNSVTDSNDDWCERYAENILSIYKSI
ncbi:hypothetical protein ACIQYS_01515 [Psychrobacillus sp. NPDC096426]|uniref:hypothetical protein n=1 Tax=Psychrobacillus sp. NPDC096426 TaxID=3364491 RepID=UPI0038279F82